MKVLIVSRNPGAKLPEGCDEGSEVAHPGAPMLGKGFDVIVLRTLSWGPVEKEWFDLLVTRLHPGGVIV